MKAPGISGKRRLLLMLVFIAAIFFALIIRLFYIQVIQGPELQEKALSQWTRDTALSAKRGRILDSNGTVLAQSGTAYKILVWPQVIKQTEQLNRERIATELAELLNMDKDYVLERITSNKQEIVLKRQVERDVVDQLSALKLGNGVGVAIDTKRYYPSSSLFSQLIGFTTVDGMGQEGLEKTYDKYLAGEDGRMITETDRKGNPLAYGSEEFIEPLDGYDLVLTTDSVVQSFLTSALEEALTINQASSAQGIVMNCKTGEIIAIATMPDYDPNSPPRDDLELLRELVKNRVVSDSYEPGSTFKIITLSSAIDSGAVDDSYSITCNGYHMVNGERIKCWRTRGHGTQNLTQVAENSCNPAFMDMALKMGTETFYDYIYAFGFGSTTGSGLTGESKGIVTHEKYIRENNLARIGFGQNIAVTPIQLVTAVSAAVNGGNLMQPYIVSKVVSQSGEVISNTEPTVVRRVISEESSAKVREILESVVENGSGKNARIAGYRVGGKTGTAQKYDESGASSSKLIASFIGFAPADDSEYVVLILVDEPQVGTIFGSTVAAPFVKTVLEETLQHYGYLPETREELVEVPSVIGYSTAEARDILRNVGLDAIFQASDAVIQQIPHAGEKVQKDTGILLYTAQTTAEPDSAAETVKVPDLTGLTRIQAYDKLAEAGLNLVIEPEDQAGTVILQKPAAGTEVEPGSEVRADFSNLNIG